MENAMATACRDVSLALVGELAKEHGFEADAAIKSLGLDRFVTKRASPKGKSKAEPKQQIKKPKMPLPFCGVANKCNCRALRLNHGLYTQCTQKPMKGLSYCKTCQQGVDRSATGKRLTARSRIGFKLELSIHGPRACSSIRQCDGSLVCSWGSWNR